MALRYGYHRSCSRGGACGDLCVPHSYSCCSREGTQSSAKACCHDGGHWQIGAKRGCGLPMGRTRTIFHSISTTESRKSIPERWQVAQRMVPAGLQLPQVDFKLDKCDAKVAGRAPQPSSSASHPYCWFRASASRFGKGRELRASDLPGLQAGEATVHDLIDIHWVNRTTLNFRLKNISYPYDAVDSFRLLCDTLVICYPDLLLPHNPSHHLLEHGRSKDAWYLEHTDGRAYLFRLDEDNVIRELGKVSSLHHAESLARAASKRASLKFYPHPLLSPVLPLWGAPRLHAKAVLRDSVARTKRVRAEQDLERRRRLAHDASSEFGMALDKVSWGEVHRLRHSSSRQRLIYFRVKGLRLSGWDCLHDRRGCPHCPSDGSDGGAVFHIVWECPAAQQLWTTLRSVAASLGLWKDLDDAETAEFLIAVFSLRLPRVPPKIWELPTLRKCLPEEDDTGAGPYPVLQAVWQQLVLETLVVINGWRSSMADESRAWSHRQAAAMHKICCQRVLDTLRYRLDRAHNTPDFAKVSLIGRTRGNPGPGGAGALLVTTASAGPSPTVLWSSATWIVDPSTTTTQAEYQGLIDGLQAAKAHGWFGLTVIGTCAPILRQLRDYRPPKNDTLLRLYHRARNLADVVGVRHWQLHVRAHNSLAATLAQHAMDSGHTSRAHHPTGMTCHADLPRLAPSDLHPWLVSQVDPR